MVREGDREDGVKVSEGQRGIVANGALAVRLVTWHITCCCGDSERMGGESAEQEAMRG